MYWCNDCVCDFHSEDVKEVQIKEQEDDRESLQDHHIATQEGPLPMNREFPLPEIGGDSVPDTKGDPVLGRRAPILETGGGSLPETGRSAPPREADANTEKEGRQGFLTDPITAENSSSWVTLKVSQPARITSSILRLTQTLSNRTNQHHSPAGCHRKGGFWYSPPGCMATIAGCCKDASSE